MDLTGRLRARAVPRPLLVTAPGGTAVRWSTEQELRRRGWPLALGPADADVLVVCGAAGEELRGAVERVWRSMAVPRARAEVRDAADVSRALDAARARLVDTAAQRAAVRAGADGVPEVESGNDGDVAGLPMADRAADRDGLALDQVHLTLGPVLPDWPAGLVVRLTLQGDVVQAAEAVFVDAAGPVDAAGTLDAGTGRTPPGPPAAVAWDDLARLLAVCGWDTAARTARRLRDDVAAGAVDDAELRRFARRVRRSRTLRWATDGLGRLDTGGGAEDATARWSRRLAVAEGRPPDAPVRPSPEVLAGLLVGRELAAVRVVVASVDLGLDVAPERQAAR